MSSDSPSKPLLEFNPDNISIFGSLRDKLGPVTIEDLYPRPTPLTDNWGEVRLTALLDMPARFTLKRFVAGLL